MFNCKSCQCKDSHIADLQKTVEFLKRQLQPTVALPIVTTEANFVLDGASSEQIEVYEPLSPEKEAELEKISQEEIAILSGDYEVLGL